MTDECPICHKPTEYTTEGDWREGRICQGACDCCEACHEKCCCILDCCPNCKCHPEEQAA